MNAFEKGFKVLQRMKTYTIKNDLQKYLEMVLLDNREIKVFEYVKTSGTLNQFNVKDITDNFYPFKDHIELDKKLSTFVSIK